MPLELGEDDDAREVEHRPVEVGRDRRFGRPTAAPSCSHRRCRSARRSRSRPTTVRSRPSPQSTVCGATTGPSNGSFTSSERGGGVAQPALRDARHDQPRGLAQPGGGERRRRSPSAETAAGMPHGPCRRRRPRSCCARAEDLVALLGVIGLLARLLDQVEHSSNVVVVDVARRRAAAGERRGSDRAQLVEPRSERALVDAARSAVDDRNRGGGGPVVEEQAIALVGPERLEREDHVTPPGAHARRRAFRCLGSNARVRDLAFSQSTCLIRSGRPTNSW